MSSSSLLLLPAFVVCSASLSFVLSLLRFLSSPSQSICLDRPFPVPVSFMSYVITGYKDFWKLITQKFFIGTYLAHYRYPSATLINRKMLNNWYLIFSVLPEPPFLAGAGAVFLSRLRLLLLLLQYSYSTANMLFLRDPKIILTLIVFWFF